jgi:hypothetical protein
LEDISSSGLLGFGNSWLRNYTLIGKLTLLENLFLSRTIDLLLLLSLVVALGAEAVGVHGSKKGFAVGAEDASVVVVVRFHLND